MRPALSSSWKNVCAAHEHKGERCRQIACHMFRIIKTITGNSHDANARASLDLSTVGAHNTTRDQITNTIFLNKFYLFIDSGAMSCVCACVCSRGGIIAVQRRKSKRMKKTHHLRCLIKLTLSTRRLRWRLQESNVAHFH